MGGVLFGGVVNEALEEEGGFEKCLVTFVLFWLGMQGRIVTWFYPGLSRPTSTSSLLFLLLCLSFSSSSSSER